MKRRIKKVYVIEMTRGLQREILKIVENEKLAEQYLEKYNTKYPQMNIICNQADYVETN